MSGELSVFAGAGAGAGAGISRQALELVELIKRFNSSVEQFKFKLSKKFTFPKTGPKTGPETGPESITKIELVLWQEASVCLDQIRSYLLSLGEDLIIPEPLKKPSISLVSPSFLDSLDSLDSSVLLSPLDSLNKNFEDLCHVLTNSSVYSNFHISKPLMQDLADYIDPKKEAEQDNRKAQILKRLEIHAYHQEMLSAVKHPGFVDLSRLEQFIPTVQTEEGIRQLRFTFLPSAEVFSNIVTADQSLLWSTILNLVTNAGKYGDQVELPSLQTDKIGKKYLAVPVIFSCETSTDATGKSSTRITVKNHGALPIEKAEQLRGVFANQEDSRVVTPSRGGKSSGRALIELIKEGAKLKLHTLREGDQPYVTVSCEVPPVKEEDLEILRKNLPSTPPDSLSGFSSGDDSRPESARATGKKIHLLAVDDDQATGLDLLEPHLKALLVKDLNWSIEVTTATSYEDPKATAWCELETSDNCKKMIFADNSIPGGIGGLDFMFSLQKAEQKAGQPLTPIVFLSADSLKDQADKLGIQNYYDNASKSPNFTSSSQLIPFMNRLWEGVTFFYDKNLFRENQLAARKLATEARAASRASALASVTGGASGSPAPITPAALGGSPLPLGRRSSSPAAPSDSPGLGSTSPDLQPPYVLAVVKFSLTPALDTHNSTPFLEAGAGAGAGKPIAATVSTTGPK